jgi:5'-nucleotidase
MTSAFHLPRILITNDDGIEAEGLAILEEVASQFADEIWVVAPAFDQSGAGQSLSLRNPIRVHKKSPHRLSVEGTPSDCVALALGRFMKETPPNLVLCGVNAGSNVGDENNISGTVGAAMTALMLGVPSIAISQCFTDRNAVPWETTRALLPKILEHFLKNGWRKETCLSVNIPALPPQDVTGMSWTHQCSKNIAGMNVEDCPNPRNAEYYWISLNRVRPETLAANADMAVLHRGEIALSALTLDRSVAITKPSILFNPTEPNDDEAIEETEEILPENE